MKMSEVIEFLDYNIVYNLEFSPESLSGKFVITNIWVSGKNVT